MYKKIIVIDVPDEVDNRQLFAIIGVIEIYHNERFHYAYDCGRIVLMFNDYGYMDVLKYINEEFAEIGANIVVKL